MALEGCIYSSGGRLTVFAIKRFRYFHEGVGDLTEIWKEKHGHLIPKTQSRPRQYKPLVPLGFKYCHGCEDARPRDEFSVDRSRGDELSGRCRKCMAKRWKNSNSQICNSCEGECVGNTCRRCYSIQVRVREAEWEALSLIPSIVYEAQKPFRDFMRELAERRNLTPQKRLMMLLERVSSGT